MFIINIAIEAVKQKVMDGRPCLFDHRVLVLKQQEWFSQSAMVQFERKFFWAQLHNLSILCMNRQYGMQNGETVGKVLDVDVDADDMRWRSFLCIHVELNGSINIRGDKF